jgi:hypothetical protein
MEQNANIEPTLQMVEIKQAPVSGVESREPLRNGNQLYILHGGQRFIPDCP